MLRESPQNHPGILVKVERDGGQKVEPMRLPLLLCLSLIWGASGTFASENSRPPKAQAKGKRKVWPGTKTFKMGLNFLRGNSVPQSDSKAAKAFAQASKEGHPRAMFYYGRLLLKGRGVKADRKAGWSWVKKAAKSGDPKAREFLENQRQRQAARQATKPAAPPEPKPAQPPAQPPAPVPAEEPSSWMGSETPAETEAPEMEEEAEASQDAVPMPAEGRPGLNDPPTEEERAQAEDLRNRLELLNPSIATTFDSIEKGVEEEQAWPMFHMGFLHEHGVHVDMDRELAKDLYRRSYEAGYDPAKVFYQDMN